MYHLGSYPSAMIDISLAMVDILSESSNPCSSVVSKWNKFIFHTKLFEVNVS